MNAHTSRFSLKTVQSVLAGALLVAAFGPLSAMASSNEHKVADDDAETHWVTDTFHSGDDDDFETDWEGTLGHDNYSETSWVSIPKTGVIEAITLGFSLPLYSSGVVIHKIPNKSFIFQVDAVDLTGALHPVWTGPVARVKGGPADFDVAWATTMFPTAGLKLYVDTSRNWHAWKDLESAKLIGQPTSPVPEMPAYAMMLTGLVLVGGVIRLRNRPKLAGLDRRHR